MCLRRYVGVLKKFSSVVEGSVIEGQMDPAVVGKFKMTPLESSMASDLKKAAEINDDVSGLVAKRVRLLPVSVWAGVVRQPPFWLCLVVFGCFRLVYSGAVFLSRFGKCWWSVDWSSLVPRVRFSGGVVSFLVAL